jgi:hypothetical protein
MTGEAISLTDSEIAMLKDKHGVVLFHMNGCGHCVNMMPAWNRVMSELKDSMKNEIVLGAIERGGIEKFHQHGIKPNVNGFPTVLYFHPSKLHSPEVYNKDRNYEGFKQWIMEKAKQDKTSRGRSRGRSRSRSRSRGKDSGVNNNQIYMAIKDYDKHKNKKNSLMVDNNNGIVVRQEGGGYTKSRKNRVKRLRRTRKHRRTHRRRSHRKNYSKIHVKSGGGGGCNCAKLW